MQELLVEKFRWTIQTLFVNGWFCVVIVSLFYFFHIFLVTFSMMLCRIHSPGLRLLSFFKRSDSLFPWCWSSICNAHWMVWFYTWSEKAIFRLYCFQPFPFSSLVPPALFFFLKNSIVETSEISTKTLIPLSFFFLSCICSHPFPWHLKFYSPFVEFLLSNLALHHNINS